MPDAILPPSEVKKAAEATLSKPDLFDSEFGYFELGESYSLRRFKCALSLTGGRVVWALIGLTATTLATLRSGFLSSFLTLLTALALYLLWNFFFAAPKKLDETLRENLRAAKKQLIEERQKGTLAVRAVVNNYSKLFDQMRAEETKNATPDLYGKVKEVYFKSTSDGLYITLRAFVGNRGADTTIQPFVLKFALNDREYIALSEDDVTDYSIVRQIKKPSGPSRTREQEATELTDLSEDNLKPLDRHRQREGWLRFRIPELVAHMRGEGGELILEIRDANDKVVFLKATHPWTQDGVIRLTSNLKAEWDEAAERSRHNQQRD